MSILKYISAIFGNIKCVNTTILIKRRTRNELRDIGSKGQTYDQLIAELVKLKKNSANLQRPLSNEL